MYASEMSGALLSRSMLIKKRTGKGKVWAACLQSVEWGDAPLYLQFARSGQPQCQSSDSSPTTFGSSHWQAFATISATLYKLWWP